MPIQFFNLSRQRSAKSAITLNHLLTWRARRLRSLRLEPDSRDQYDIAAIDRVLVNVAAHQITISITFQKNGVDIDALRGLDTWCR